MRKNVFSFSKLILAVSLAVATMATSFVGCKNYDDDIKGLQDQITKVVKDLADLKADFDANGLKVSNISQDGDVVTITTTAGGAVYKMATAAAAIPTIEIKKQEDGSYKLMVNGKQAGDAIIIPGGGKDVTIEKVAGGYQLMIDGKAEGALIADPTLTLTDGELFLNGKATGIKIPASTTSYFVKDELTETIQLFMPDKDGKVQPPITLSYAPAYGDLLSLAFVPEWIESGLNREKFFMLPTTTPVVKYVSSTPDWTFRINPTTANIKDVKWSILAREAHITKAAGDMDGLLISIENEGTQPEIVKDAAVFSVQMISKGLIESEGFEDYAKKLNEELAEGLVNTFDNGAIVALKANVAENKDIVSDYVNVTYRTAKAAIIRDNSTRDLQTAGRRIGANHTDTIGIGYYSAGYINAGEPAYSGTNLATSITKANNATAAKLATTIARKMKNDYYVSYKNAAGEANTFDLKDYVAEAAWTEKKMDQFVVGGKWYNFADLDFNMNNYTYSFSEVEEGINIEDDTEKTDQQWFVSLKEGSSIATVEQGSAAVDRTPIFNVALKTGNDTIATAYIKVKIVRDVVDPKPLEVTYDAGDIQYASLYQATEVKTGDNINTVAFPWKQFNTEVYKALDMSHEDFKARYTSNGAYNVTMQYDDRNEVTTPTSNAGLVAEFDSTTQTGVGVYCVRVEEIGTPGAGTKTFTPLAVVMPGTKFGAHTYKVTIKPNEENAYRTVVVYLKYNLVKPTLDKRMNPNYCENGDASTKKLIANGMFISPTYVMQMYIGEGFYFGESTSTYKKPFISTATPAAIIAQHNFVYKTGTDLTNGTTLSAGGAYDACLGTYAAPNSGQLIVLNEMLKAAHKDVKMKFETTYQNSQIDSLDFTIRFVNPLQISVTPQEISLLNRKDGQEDQIDVDTMYTVKFRGDVIYESIAGRGALNATNAAKYGITTGNSSMEFSMKPLADWEYALYSTNHASTIVKDPAFGAGYTATWYNAGTTLQTNPKVADIMAKFSVTNIASITGGGITVKAKQEN